MSASIVAPIDLWICHDAGILAHKKALLAQGFFGILLSQGYWASLTFLAAGPLGPCSMSKVTVAPSLSSSKDTPCRSLEWKKRSLVSPSRAIKPKPLSVFLLTVPVIIFFDRNF